mgnify:FL=1
MREIVVELRPIEFFSVQDWEDELHVVMEQIVLEFGPIVRTPLTPEEPIDLLFLLYQVTTHDPGQLGHALDRHLGVFSPPGPRVCIYACGRAAVGQVLRDEDVRQLAVDSATGHVATAIAARAVRPANFGDLARQEIHRMARHRNYGMLPPQAFDEVGPSEDEGVPDWGSM